MSVPREARDLRFLRSELVDRMRGPLACALTRRLELDPRALAKRIHPKAGEHLVSDPQLVTGVEAPMPASEPLAVEQMRARELRPKPRAAKSLDRLAVQRLGRVAVCQQRPRTGRDPQPPVGAGDGRVLREAFEGASGMSRRLAPAGRLDQLSQ